MSKHMSPEELADSLKQSWQRSQMWKPRRGLFGKRCPSCGARLRREPAIGGGAKYSCTGKNWDGSKCGYEYYE